MLMLYTLGVLRAICKSVNVHINSLADHRNVFSNVLTGCRPTGDASTDVFAASLSKGKPKGKGHACSNGGHGLVEKTAK